jgi:endo-1,3-1,4-beta-glycanase ExoK
MNNIVNFTTIIILSFVSCSKNTINEPIIKKDATNTTYYETFDLLGAKWVPQLCSFDENGSNMVKENISINNSILELIITKNSIVTLPKPFNAGEIGDSTFHLYGYYEVRMKPMIKSGTVGSFFLMNEWVSNNWGHKEIDIEFTGNKKTSIQLTTHDYQNGGADHKFSTTIKELSYKITEEFHNYGILWTKDSVSWFVDGNLLHTEKLFVPHVPLQIRLNHWAGDMNIAGIKVWLGEINENELPSMVQYDWIKFQSLNEYFKLK